MPSPHGVARGAISLVFVVLGAGCGPSHEYVCPDPVGRIILDDCEIYKTKYEALKVELGASFAGLFTAQTSLQKASLRDPTELIQVLSMRTLALCKDFNACRVPPLEYRQRREQTDRVFTAVATIQEQLKGQLDPESKAKLVLELVRVLSEDRSPSGSSGEPRGSSTATGGSGEERPSRQRRLGPYRSWVPWFDTRLLPPQPRAVSGFPVLAHASFNLEHVFRQESPYGTTGYRPTATFYLWGGRVEADDIVTVDWGGRTSDCPIGHGDENGLARLRCEPPKKLSLTGASFTVRLTYRRGGDGKSAMIGQRTVPVLSFQDESHRKGSLTYGIDHDPQAREGRLVFRPHDGMPPELEQPSLLVVLKLRKYMKATARCWVNGQVATPGLESSRYSGQDGTFQDRQRYRRTGPGSSEGVADAHIEWWRHDFPLPFVYKRGSTPAPEKLKPWPLPGKWRCVVSVEGEPVRELAFRIASDGKPAAHPRQTEQPDAGWLLETKHVQNPFEVPIR